LIQIGIRKLLYISIGIMLLAFGVISLTMDDFNLSMLPVTVLMFVGGFYLARKGITGYIHDARGEPGKISRLDSSRKGDICPNCGSEVIPGQKFCIECGKKL